MAKKSGVSQQLLSYYENGKREPSASAALALARAVGVSVDWLLSGKPAPVHVATLTEAIDLALERRLPIGKRASAELIAKLYAVLADPSIGEADKHRAVEETFQAAAKKTYTPAKKGDHK